jgi:phage terminase small subunit
MELTIYEWVFIGEYLIDFNATKAVERAQRSMGVAVSKWSGQEGYKLLKSPKVAAEIESSINKIKQKQSASVEMVINDALAVLNADPRDLVTLQHGACRYCHGRDHLCQYTDGEQNRRRKVYQTTDDWLIEGIPFDNEGGVGYDRTAEPHPGCPECAGVGIERITMKDAMQLSPDAVKLLAGWRQTKNGLEVIMRSKDAARDTLAKYQGMYKDPSSGVNVNVTVNGNLANLTDEQLEKLARGEQ